MLLGNITVSDVKIMENELRLYDKDIHKLYAYDLSFTFKNKKYIVEYDTPFMHPNPKYMSADELKSWRNVFSLSMEWETKYKIDEQKRAYAEKEDYTVLVFYVNSENSIDANITRILKILK
jgi:hypothetical protein